MFHSNHFDLFSFSIDFSVFALLFFAHFLSYCKFKTHASINAELPYRVVIFPSKKYGPVTTTATVWVAISGTLCETQQVTIPRSSLEFVFHVSFQHQKATKKNYSNCVLQHFRFVFRAQHKNLGILTTLRIGHDNSGPSAKWMVEHILVRNEVTGHTYK